MLVDATDNGFHEYVLKGFPLRKPSYKPVMHYMFHFPFTSSRGVHTDTYVIPIYALSLKPL